MRAIPDLSALGLPANKDEGERQFANPPMKVALERFSDVRAGPKCRPSRPPIENGVANVNPALPYCTKQRKLPDNAKLDPPPNAHPPHFLAEPITTAARKIPKSPRREDKDDAFDPPSPAAHAHRTPDGPSAMPAAESHSQVPD